MKFFTLRSFCLTVLTIVIFAGCAGEIEIAQETVPTSKNISASSNTSMDPAASIVESKISIPDDFPDDIYIMDGAKSAELHQSGGKDNLVLKYAESEGEDLINRFLDGMSRKGWTKQASSKLPIGTITNFTKSDRRCTISIGPPKDQVITVAVIY